MAALPLGLRRLVVIAGAGHVTWLDVPDGFWPMLLDFVGVTVQQTAAWEVGSPTLT